MPESPKPDRPADQQRTDAPPTDQQPSDAPLQRVTRQPSAPKPSTSDSEPSTPAPLSDEELRFLQSVLDLARDGGTAELAAMVAQGVPVNLSSGAGDSLLILAAYHDHPDIVRMLLEHGADTGRVNDRGQTALGAAVFRQSRESVTALLSRGADPHAGGRSAQEIAEFFDLPEMTALLRLGRDESAG